MNIEELSVYVWDNSTEISFGRSAKWDPDLFKANWAKKNKMYPIWKGMTNGWYWFCVKSSYRRLLGLSRPITLPAKACNFNQSGNESVKTFGKELLCEHDQNRWLVVYNGHEKTIKNRVRSHFSLKNARTGALGLIHYPVSHWEWKVRMFSYGQIGQHLPNADKQQLIKLMEAKSGRTAIETSWRATYGWPVFCKA